MLAYNFSNQEAEVQETCLKQNYPKSHSAVSTNCYNLKHHFLKIERKFLWNKSSSFLKLIYLLSGIYYKTKFIQISYDFLVGVCFYVKLSCDRLCCVWKWGLLSCSWPEGNWEETHKLAVLIQRFFLSFLFLIHMSFELEKVLRNLKKLLFI